MVLREGNVLGFELFKIWEGREQEVALKYSNATALNQKSHSWKLTYADISQTSDICYSLH